MPEAKATEIRVQFDPSKHYQVALDGKQISLLLSIIDTTHFRGSQVFEIGDVITALQTPLLQDAHGAEQTET